MNDSIDVDEHYIENDENFTKEGVKLIVEEQEGSLVITYADLLPDDTYHLVILLIDRLSAMVGQEYNQVLEDLKEIEEESE